MDRLVKGGDDGASRKNTLKRVLPHKFAVVLASNLGPAVEAIEAGGAGASCGAC